MDFELEVTTAFYLPEPVCNLGLREWGAVGSTESRNFLSGLAAITFFTEVIEPTAALAYCASGSGKPTSAGGAQTN